MKIKKFKAKNFTEALKLVKKELSDDAVILSTEEKKGVRPFVEVTAAVDYDVEKASKPKGQAALNENKQSLPPVPDSDVAAPNHEAQIKYLKSEISNIKSEMSTPPSNDVRDLIIRLTEDIKDEVEGLRDTILDMKSVGYEMSMVPKKKMILHFLKERMIREEFALLLCEKAKDIDEIPSLIVSDIKIRDPLSGRKAIMLIGSTGVGKTTTVAKLAGHAIKEGKKAAIINLDTYRIGAVEQARIYSRIMGIPLANASNNAELKSSLARFSETRDIVFIDTTGRNPMDTEYIESLSELDYSEIPIEMHLLVNANCDDGFMTEAYKNYRKLPINYLGFTKIDEAIKYGSLYNLLLTYRKPIAYLTTGQKVPNDIEFATVERIANLILKKECFKC